MASSVPMTDDVGQFIGSLLEGDVLLFDTLHPLSNLIKFAENRPVNHCALFLGGGTFAHVGRHIPDPEGKGPPVKPAARVEDLAQWLHSPPGPHDRTVTALRHSKIEHASDAAGVIARAQGYVAPKDTTYNYVSLIGLMVPSLLRTYRNYLGNQGAMKLVVGTMQAFSHALIDVLEQDVASLPSESRTLTCSEFIYRCFDESGKDLCLTITEPLGTWTDPKNLRRPDGDPPTGGTGGAPSVEPGPTTGPADDGPIVSTVVTIQSFDGGGEPPVVSGEGLVHFNDSFRTEVLGPAGIRISGDWADSVPLLGPLSGTPPVQAFFGGSGWDVAVLAGKAIVEMIRSNQDLKKYDEAARSAKPGDVFADLVTPRDLWGSPTLSAVAVLHRPPSRQDTDLDGTPPTTAAFGD